MREILFRGKRKDNGEWIKGDFLQDRDLEQYMIEYFDYYYDENGHQRDYCQYEVDPSTVGQFTGLTANGKKIFEGDIVQYGDTVHEVVFEQRNGTAYFGLVYSSIETLPFGHYQDLKQITILGNIYDNPELLEVNGDA